jgi:hypothetical protein
MWSQPGEWPKVVNSGEITRFMKSGGVSQKLDEFVPLDIKAGPIPLCKVPTNTGGIHPPSQLFTPEPDYPPSARLAKKEGYGSIGLVVALMACPMTSGLCLLRTKTSTQRP